jgi:cullin-4
MISSGATGRKKLRDPGKPTKRLKISLSKSKPKVPDTFEAEMWTKLCESTTAIFSQSPVAHSREELYRAVEDLCIHKLSANLFTKLKQEVDRHIGAKVLSLVGQTPDLGAYLELVTRMWQDYCDHMLTIRSIFLYLDRTYILQSTEARSFWDMGLVLLRSHLNTHPEVKTKVRWFNFDGPECDVRVIVDLNCAGLCTIATIVYVD